jgi:hypothetical protein
MTSVSTDRPVLVGAERIVERDGGPYAGPVTFVMSSPCSSASSGAAKATNPTRTRTQSPTMPSRSRRNPRQNDERAARRRARTIARAEGMSCLIPALALQQRDINDLTA